jgi:predicted nucleic acid-binding protein
MKTTYVLDAWALLALLQQEEPAASHVKQLIEGALAESITLYISIINLGEVTYRIGKVKGENEAWETFQQIQQLPVTVLSATDEMVLTAVTHKMHHAISYADAFAIATTQQQQGILVTGDPELIHLKDLIPIEPLHRV